MKRERWTSTAATIYITYPGERKGVSFARAKQIAIPRSFSLSLTRAGNRRARTWFPLRLQVQIAGFAAAAPALARFIDWNCPELRASFFSLSCSQAYARARTSCFLRRLRAALFSPRALTQERRIEGCCCWFLRLTRRNHPRRLIVCKNKQYLPADRFCSRGGCCARGAVLAPRPFCMIFSSEVYLGGKNLWMPRPFWRLDFSLNAPRAREQWRVQLYKVLGVLCEQARARNALLKYSIPTYGPLWCVAKNGVYE